MQLQTTEFMAGIRRLVLTVGEMNGYLISAQVYGRDLRTPEAERYASYVFRLHTDRLAEFIMEMEDNYNLLSLRQLSDDITTEHRTVGTALEDMRGLEAIILKELEDEELDPADRRNLEAELNALRSSIRNLETHQSEMDDSILYSTVTVHLGEVIFVEVIEEEPEEEPTFGERFSLAASRSWDGFIGFCQGLLIIIIRILPTLLILGAIAVVTFLIVRKYRKWRAENPKPPKAQKPPYYAGYQNQSWNNNANQQYSDPNTITDNTNASTEDKPGETNEE